MAAASPTTSPPDASAPRQERLALTLNGAVGHLLDSESRLHRSVERIDASLARLNESQRVISRWQLLRDRA